MKTGPFSGAEVLQAHKNRAIPRSSPGHLHIRNPYLCLEKRAATGIAVTSALIQRRAYISSTRSEYQTKANTGNQ